MYFPSSGGMFREGGQPVYSNIPVTGMVAEKLGADSKPVCIYNQTVADNNIPEDQQYMALGAEGCRQFGEWYNDVPAVETTCDAAAVFGPYDANTPQETLDKLPKAGTPVSCHTGNIRVDGHLDFHYDSETATWSFQDEEFFPLNGCGFDDKVSACPWCTSNIGSNGGKPAWSYYTSTFLFTSELQFTFRFADDPDHRLFFDFEGDDDVWVFVNDILIFDLGGVHWHMQGRVYIDIQPYSCTTDPTIVQNGVPFPTHNCVGGATKAGLVKGGVYGMHVFHAERQSTNSAFKVQTNLWIPRPCDSPPPSPPSHPGRSLSPPPPAGGPPKQCKLYGDPHVDTFDGVKCNMCALPPAPRHEGLSTRDLHACSRAMLPLLHVPSMPHVARPGHAYVPRATPHLCGA